MLGAEVKGCRKTFTVETFNLHVCDDTPPVHFRGMESKFIQPLASVSKPVSRKQSWDSSDDEDAGNEELMKLIAGKKEEGLGVCLGWEEHETLSLCCMCDYTTKTAGNMYQHVRRHCGLKRSDDTQFCHRPREASTMADNSRGCRKCFLATTFDQHTCTDDKAKQIGNFPLRVGGINVKKGKKKQYPSQFRGFEQNFGVPDGSPAKFYSDRYLRVFSQLGIQAPTERIGASNMWDLDYLTVGQMAAVRDYVEDPGERYFLKPQVVPICTECLGTEACNPIGEAESLVSCWGCGQSVHPSCRVYATELVAYFEQHGWTCDDCKACIVCDESPSESEKSEDLLVCEYCDQGIHYTCLKPLPEKRPKVWNCDDCRTARGMKPLGNINKFRAEVADLVKKAASKSLFANRTMLGYEDSDSLEAHQVVVVEDGEGEGEEQEQEQAALPALLPPAPALHLTALAPPPHLGPGCAREEADQRCAAGRSHGEGCAAVHQVPGQGPSLPHGGEQGPGGRVRLSSRGAPCRAPHALAPRPRTT